MNAALQSRFSISRTLQEDLHMEIWIYAFMILYNGQHIPLIVVCNVGSPLFQWRTSMGVGQGGMVAPQQFQTCQM